MLAILMLFCMSLSYAFAQSVVGSAQVEGRDVELLDDNTWRFASKEPPAPCKPLDLGVSFCGSEEVWVPFQPPNPDVQSAYRHDDRNYALFVMETIGSNDGLTLDSMKKAVLNVTGGKSGSAATDIPVISVEPAKVDKYAGETIVFQLGTAGMRSVFAETLILLPDRSFQIVTYSLGSEFTAQHRSLHDEFLSLVRIDPSK